jgi:hypothetical protein
MLLGSVGIGSAWFFGIAMISGPASACISRRGRRLSCCKRRASGLVPVGYSRCAGLRSSRDHADCCRVPIAWRGNGDCRIPVRMMRKSVLICPNCGHAKSETMPTDACLFFYDCEDCGAALIPKAGDCCVFCSYGSVPCPPVQESGRGCHCDWIGAPSITLRRDLGQDLAHRRC